MMEPDKNLPVADARFLRLILVVMIGLAMASGGTCLVLAVQQEAVVLVASG